MQLDGLFGVVYNITNWIMRFAYVNLLWVFFSLVGLIVLGFFPATTSLFAVTRKWVMGDTDIPIFKTFWNSYRTEFLSANLIGLVLCLLGYILYIDFIYIQTLDRLLATILFAIFITLSLAYTVTFLYIFPIMVHFNLKTFRYIKIAFMVGLASPFTTILMIAGLMAVYFLIRFIPGLIPFFLGSTVSVIIMWCSFHAINRIDQKNKNN